MCRCNSRSSKVFSNVISPPVTNFIDVPQSNRITGWSEGDSGSAIINLDVRRSVVGCISGIIDGVISG